MKGVFKCVKEDDERRSGSVKRSSLGMPPCTHKTYSRRFKRLSFGMPPCIPFSINNHQFVLRLTIFLSLHVLCAMLGASPSQVLFLVSLALLAVHNKLDPFLLCVGEKHAQLSKFRTHHRILPAYLLAVVCSLSFHSYCHVQFQSSVVLARALDFVQFVAGTLFSFHVYLVKESWLLH